MENYENYSVSEQRLHWAKKIKSEKFAKKYFKANGQWPSLAQVASGAKLTAEDIENLRSGEYASLYVEQNNSAIDVTPPPVNENTPEQEEVAASIAEMALNGEKTITVEGEINNFTIPADVTVSPTITGELADGATIKSESTKYFILVNTSEEPVSVSVEAAGTVYLRGKYNDVYLNGKSLSVSSSIYPEINGTVTIDPSVEGNVSVSAIFGEDAKVVYYNNEKLTISNGASTPDASVEVIAPNATVEIGGKYDELTASVSENTLILKPAFHTNKLDVKKGNVMFYGVNLDKFADNVTLGEGVTAYPYSLDITAANYSKMTSNGGIYTLAEDVILSNRNIAFGIFGNGEFTYNLNGHTLACGRQDTASIYLRGTTPTINITGEGTLLNNTDSYGVWVASTGATLNVYSGNFSAYTHVLYAYEGTINVYGGAFKLLGEYDTDAKGHAKFLLNCYDANYTAGKAHINVYGGKFYNFNPAESYGEPGSPVSFVAEGYHVVESEENGVPVFEVVAD